MKASRGYILFEVMIAVAIFAIVAIGLSQALEATIAASNSLNRQTAIRYGLESVLNEARQRQKREEMRLDYRDEKLDVYYRTELEEARLINRNLEPVSGIWTLRAIAEHNENGEARRDQAEVYVYRP